MQVHAYCMVLVVGSTDSDMPHHIDVIGVCSLREVCSRVPVTSRLCVIRMSAAGICCGLVLFSFPGALSTLLSIPNKEVPGALSTLLRPQCATEGSIPNKEVRPPSEESISAVKGGKLEQLALGSGAKAARAGTSSVAVSD